MLRDYQEQNTMFNMGIATLIRIDHILKDLYFDNKEGNPMLIQRDLKGLFKEVAPFIMKDQELLGQGNKYLTDIKCCIELNNEGNPVCIDDIENLFDDFELWLRYRLKSCGLLMRLGDNPNEAILG